MHVPRHRGAFGSLTAAGRHSGLSSPSVSEQIRTLKQKLIARHQAHGRGGISSLRTP
jgi:hypothetical protein